MAETVMTTGPDIEVGVAAPGMREFCIEVIFTTDTCIKYLRNRGLLASAMSCSCCGYQMSIVKRCDVSDGESWRCPNCYGRCTIRKNSFFEKSRLPLMKIMHIIWCFCIDLQVYQAKKLIPDMNESTIIDWYSFCRDICTKKIEKYPFRLGGEIDSNFVEIGESLFGKKRKYHRGTGRQDMWIFGLVERGTRNVVLRYVENRTKDTLIPIIEESVSAGTTIYSDEWASYKCLEEKGYKHGTVNHSKEFKSSDGVCTNTIEGIWGLVKNKIKAMKGCRHERLGDVLDEFMYRYKYGNVGGDIYNRMLCDIGEFYRC